MAVRKLPNRRKRATKGRVIRISDQVYKVLDEQRKRKSWDSFIRKLLGLEDRQGNSQRLIEGMVETVTGKFILKDDHITWEKLEEKAYEIGILAAAKMKLKRIDKPLRMRELP